MVSTPVSVKASASSVASRHPAQEPYGSIGQCDESPSDACCCALLTARVNW